MEPANYTAEILRRLSASLPQKVWRSHNHELGCEAELLVTQILRQEHHEILSRNYRGRGFELDIVARSPEGCLIAVEVKARSVVLTPCDLMPPTKRQALARGLDHYMSCYNGATFVAMRIDLAVVLYRGRRPHRFLYFPNC